MTRKVHPMEASSSWIKLRAEIQGDYLDTLLDEEFEREFEGDDDEFSEIERARVAKSIGRLRKGLFEMLEATGARPQRPGVRAAADDGENTREAETNAYTLLPWSFAIGGRSYGVGLANEEPREIVLITKKKQQFPDGVAGLRIGDRDILLTQTADARVRRCRGLGEPRLRELLEISPSPSVRFLVAADA